MREVVSFIMGVILMLYVLYFALPMLSNEKAATASILNQTDPTIAQSLTLGAGFYAVLPFAGILVGIFLIIAFALRREQFE